MYVEKWRCGSAAGRLVTSPDLFRTRTLSILDSFSRGSGSFPQECSFLVLTTAPPLGSVVMDLFHFLFILSRRQHLPTPPKSREDTHAAIEMIDTMTSKKLFKDKQWTRKLSWAFQCTVLFKTSQHFHFS
jgi:hypothetical protein